MQQQKNLSAEHAHQLYLENVNLALEKVIDDCRKKYKVTEQAMNSAFKQHQTDPEVRAALQNVRMVGNPSAGASSEAAAVEVPASLTRDKLREIMTFNAVTLEKELKPIREQIEKIRAQGNTPQVSPQVLEGVQQRISQAVSARYGVTNEQVMAAVEKFEARTDPAFRDILLRISNAFNSSLA